MDHALRHEILTILEDGRDLTLATVDEEGAPHATTVSYANDGLSIYFGCGAGSQKARNLAHDPRVALTVDLAYADWNNIRGLSVRGTAARLVNADQLLEVGRLFATRFPQLGEGFALGGVEMALFCITPQRIALLDYRKGFGHVDYVEAAELEAVPIG